MTHGVGVQDSVIERARVHAEDEAFHVAAAPKDTTAAELARMDLGGDEDGDDDVEAEEAMRSIEQTVQDVASTGANIETPAEKELHSFEIDPSQVRDSRGPFSAHTRAPRGSLLAS